jgi:hypothetical protein
MGGVTLSYDNFGSGLGSASVSPTGITGGTYGSLILTFASPVTSLSFDFALGNATGPIGDALAITFKGGGNDVSDFGVSTANYSPYDPARPENGGSSSGSVRFSGAAFDQAILFFSPDAGSFSVGNTSYANGSLPALTNVVVTPGNGFVAVGGTASFGALAQYVDGTSGGLPSAQVEWRSSNQAVGSIDSAGVASGLAPGTTTITAFAGGFSGSATFTVLSGPAIVTQPQSTTVSFGASATLGVTATGGLLTYQWQFDGRNIAGATNSSLILSNLDPNQSGEYVVVVSNPVGSVTSSEAVVSLLRLNMYAGLTIVGVTGGHYKIEYRTSFATNTWATLTNLNLPASPYFFIDMLSPGTDQKFYRVSPVP